MSNVAVTDTSDIIANEQLPLASGLQLLPHPLKEEPAAAVGASDTLLPLM